jgi:hypothetical protein
MTSIAVLVARCTHQATSAPQQAFVIATAASRATLREIRQGKIKK